MLDIKYIRENCELVKKATATKNCKVDFDRIIALDQERRDLIQRSEDLKRQLNAANEAVAKIKREGGDASSRFAELKTVSQSIKDLDGKLNTIQEELNALLLYVPNVAHESVPVGGPEANKVMREWGTIPTFSFEPKDHLTIAENLGYIHMGRGSKISGSGFVLYQGMGARLERALIQFMLDMHTKKHGYTEVSTPFVVNRASMQGTGQLPKFEEDMYALKHDELFLIPTAEVPVTNILRDEIIDESALPIKYTAYSPCFRREAGSYGKDTRGLSRVHQFDKVELVKFVKPEDSFQELESLTNDAEAILQALEIPYRIVLLAAGDMSFSAAKCYDIEIWAAGTKKWFEVSSCSNFVDFQARRANIKYRDAATKKTNYVHTLNGSGVALARLVLALLENNQQADGTVVFPKALEKYLS